MKIGINPQQFVPASALDNVDITGADIVEIRIRHDKKVIWITVHEGDRIFSLRVCRIKELVINNDNEVGTLAEELEKNKI